MDSQSIISINVVYIGGQGGSVGSEHPKTLAMKRDF